jgi:hypothetical protein
MVVLETLLNNVKRKVYGRPVDVSPNAVYYCVIEEQEFTGIGDCILLQSNHQVSRSGHFYPIPQARSILPIWLAREEYHVEPSAEPIVYITFFLPDRLKMNLADQPIENHVGLVFQ